MHIVTTVMIFLGLECYSERVVHTEVKENALRDIIGAVSKAMVRGEGLTFKQPSTMFYLFILFFSIKNKKPLRAELKCPWYITDRLGRFTVYMET